ncbi:MAG: hypothetical protein GH144_02650 [Clostridia bacterium]|jgi:hypothetical protein|nr:hypothetical protein [Clostridia bacterium]
MQLTPIVDHAYLLNVTPDQHHARDHKARHQKDGADDLESLLCLANLAEKSHLSLTNVTASQHHTKTTSGEISLAGLAEKSHNSLTNVTASQHHTKTGLDNTPVNGQTAEGITSNWAYDHNVNANAHHAQSHTLASHSTKAHSELTGVTASQHHTKFTTAEHDTSTRHPVSVIKTGSGSATGSGAVNITMHRKSFFPQLTQQTGGKILFTVPLSSDPNDYRGRVHIDNGSGYTYWVRWDYLSSSGPPQIWVITDISGKIICCWEADDPSNPEKPDVCPIEAVGENGKIRKDLQTLKVKIPSNYKTIKDAAKQARKGLSQYLIDEYDIDLKTKKLKKKK